MKPLEGIDPDECKTLRDGLAETDELLEETRREIAEETQKENPNLEKVERLSEEVEDTRSVQHQLRKTVAVGCGIKFYPTGEEDVGKLDCDGVHEVYETLDEVENDVADSMPRKIVEADIGFQEDVDMQRKQKSFVRSSSLTKDALEEFTESRDCEVPDERNDRDPAGSMVVECNHPDPEAREECLERRVDGDTRFTLDPRQYGNH